MASLSFPYGSAVAHRDIPRPQRKQMRPTQSIGSQSKENTLFREDSPKVFIRENGSF